MNDNLDTEHFRTIHELTTAHEWDLGDGEFTPDHVFNVCLMPGIGSGSYSTELSNISQQLADQNQSDYILYPYGVPEKSLTASNIHATLGHIVVPPTMLEQFAEAVKPFMGHEEIVTVTGLLSLEGKPFDRLAKATDGAHRRLPEGIVDNVVWANIHPTDSFMDLQQRIYDATVGEHPEMKFLTGMWEQALPHNTVYVNRKPAGTYSVSPPLPHLPSREVPCRVALADCGPWGQVRRYILLHTMVDEFVRKVTSPEPR